MLQAHNGRWRPRQLQHVLLHAATVLFRVRVHEEILRRGLRVALQMDGDTWTSAVLITRSLWDIVVSHMHQPVECTIIVTSEASHCQRHIAFARAILSTKKSHPRVYADEHGDRKPSVSFP